MKHDRLPAIANGRHLRAARILAGLTQVEMAVACGLHPNSVRYWERQSHIGSAYGDALLALIEVLARRGVHIDFSASGSLTITSESSPRMAM